MEDKNEVEKNNEGKEKKEEEEIDQKLFSNYSKDFSILLEEKNLQFKLLQHIYELDNFKYEKLAAVEKKMEELEKDITLNIEEITKIKDTPIFRLYIILREINKIELNHFQRYHDYILSKGNYLSSIACFIQDYMYLDNYSKIIGPLKEELYDRYRKIELKSIDKYLKEKYYLKLTRQTKIKSTYEITKANQTENRINSLIKQNNEKVNPNAHLKNAFYRLNIFSNSIMEEDKNKLNDLKKEINSIYELSEKGQIYEIWNFNAPMIQSEYKFKLFNISSIPLDDKFELNKENKYDLKDKDSNNILNFIKDRKEGGIALLLNKMADEILKSKNLINEILDTNSTQVTISENVVEELMKLLYNYNNIRATLQVLNNFRAKSFGLKKEVFDIVVKIFKKFADYFFNNPDYELVSILILMSQTYYLNETEKEEEKHFISNEIKEHKLFKIEAFWKKSLSYLLTKEAKNLPSKISIEKIRRGELNEEKTEKVYTILLGAIATFPKSAYVFGVPKENLERIVNEVCREYPKQFQDMIKKFLSDQLSNQKKK